MREDRPGRSPHGDLPAAIGDVCCSLTHVQSKRFVFGVSCLWRCTFKGTDFLEIPQNAPSCFPVRSLTDSVLVPMVTFNFYTHCLFSWREQLSCVVVARSQWERVAHQRQGHGGSVSRIEDSGASFPGCLTRGREARREWLPSKAPLPSVPWARGLGLSRLTGRPCT